jgi:hypothetical protein
MGQYDFGALYGQADASIFVYEPGLVDAVVEASTWGRTKDGSKGQWDVRFRVTTGQDAGRAQIKFPMTVTTEGASAAQSLGIMFRHLESMGVPSEWVRTNPPEEQIAQAMVGKPVQLKIIVDEYEGVQRNKVRDVRPPRPGAPTTWPQYQPQMAATPQYGQAQYGQPAYPGGVDPWQTPAPAQPQPQYGGQIAPQAYGQPQAPAPMYPGQPTFQQPGQAPQPYAGQPQQAPAPQQPQSAPPWAQPGQTQQQYEQQSQAPQQQAPQFPGTAPYAPPQAPQQADPWATQAPTAQANGADPSAPPWAQPGAQQAAQQQPPWAQQQPPQAPQAPFTPPAPSQAPAAPWNGQQAPQTDQQTGPQGAPPPPWAQ